MPNINWQDVLAQRPDVAAEYQRVNAQADPNSPWYAQHGLDNGAEGFAQWWYNNKPAADTYTYTATPPPPPVVPDPVTTPPPYTPPPVTTPTDTGGTGAGTAVTPGGNRDVAFQQALMQARLTLIGQGLDPNVYLPQIQSYLQDVYNIIPTSEMNAAQYFDPNVAQIFLNGKKAGNQSAARGQVNSVLGRPSLDYTSLDATISRLLGEGIKEGEDYLTRGKTRGQFNDAGYTAGQTRLQQAKLKAQGKLKGYAEDIYGRYSTQFSDLQGRATSAADNSGFDGFDISPYKSEYDRIASHLSGPGLESELLSQVGDEPLIDLSFLRGAVAKGQGSANLQDLDVLDGITKRKKASELGRGVGSQGAF